MTDNKYRDILKETKADYWRIKGEAATLRKKQDELEKQLVGLREIIVATSRMLGEEFSEEDELGLTDAIRQVFKTSKNLLNVPGVEMRLRQLGYDFSNYATPESVRASISTVVTRLAAKREITLMTTGTIRVYRWAGKE